MKLFLSILGWILFMLGGSCFLFPLSCMTSAIWTGDTTFFGAYSGARGGFALIIGAVFCALASLGIVQARKE